MDFRNEWDLQRKNLSYKHGLVAFCLLGTAVALFWSSSSRHTNASKTEKKEISALVNQAITLSAGEDRIWSLPEQRQFLDEMPLKNDRALVEGESIYFVPEGETTDVYSGAARRADVHADRYLLPENHLGNLDRQTLESYISRNASQAQRE